MQATKIKKTSFNKVDLNSYSVSYAIRDLVQSRSESDFFYTVI